MFILGAAFADIENLKGWRPLDKLRNLNMCLAIVKNLVLLFFFLSYGSYNGEDNCKA